MNKADDLQSAVDKIHSALLASTNKIIITLSTRGEISREMLERWVEYANQLQRLVPEYAIPNWLNTACENFGNQFKGDSTSFQQVTAFVVLKTPEICRPILIGEAASLDIEELFSIQSEKVNLTTTFEKLVSQLSELIAADVINDRLVDESLKRLHALFLRNKRGSLAAVLLTMNFGRFFLKSFAGLLRENKLAKPFVESFEKEFNQAQEIVQQAEEATKKEMISRLTSKARIQLFLEQHPELRPTISGFLPPPDNQ